MPGIDRKNFESPDEKRPFDKGAINVITLGKKTVGRAVFEPGWRWSESVKPIVGTDSCQVAHLGYSVSGPMHVVMDDGSEVDLSPGDLFDIAPGHDAWIVGNEPCIALDFEGASNYAKA